MTKKCRAKNIKYIFFFWKQNQLFEIICKIDRTVFLGKHTIYISVFHPMKWIEQKKFRTKKNGRRVKIVVDKQFLWHVEQWMTEKLQQNSCAIFKNIVKYNNIDNVVRAIRIEIKYKAFQESSFGPSYNSPYTCYQNTVFNIRYILSVCSSQINK